MLVSPNSSLRSFLGQRLFKLGEDPSSFRVWRECDLTQFWDVLKKGCLCSKQELESRIKRKLSWFEYAQLAHFLKHSEIAPDLGHVLTPFETLMMA